MGYKVIRSSNYLSYHVLISRCRVKSIEQPHIKWLRKLHTASSSSVAVAEPFTSNHRGDVLSIYRDANDSWKEVAKEIASKLSLNLKACPNS